MGIGNYDRADDFAGIAVLEKLETQKYSESIKIINAGPVPEAYTSVIKQHNTELLVIIDAAMMDEKPGTIKIFTDKDIDDIYMITPHRIPMSMYTKYLRYFLENLQAIFIGIQPASLSYDIPMSDEVKSSVLFLSEYLDEILKKLNFGK